MEDALPPSYEESEAAHRQASSAPDISKPLLTLVSMRDAELRNALYKYIENKFSYGSRFIEEMILTEIWNDCAFVYTLESMAETRDYGNKIIAYDGWIEEGPEDDSGLPPYHWEVPVQVPTEFADSNVVTEIPHTGYIKQCLRCYGQKEHKCNYCSGQGKQPCGRCGGGGIDDDGSICIRCNRTGKVWCSDCEGRKKLACSLCRGSGKLKHFDQLVVAWKYQKCSEISNVSELPTEIVCKASGKEIYKDQGVTVQPLNFPNNRYLNEISARLIASQNSQRDVRIAAQRHSVIAIPYTRATYIWKKKKGKFYVYGFQKNIYFKEYPQQYFGCVCF
ncbi:protein SSUH2 [Trichonephila inaurata madagascariensis]|uniref:Protein SSUH2 n=1 Tax=Trichonephila inaurata madagascariensis TaxID=2747483 RepID=A0A8X7C5H3_9ARAC|nr:protein SSUH2 [Trichonephila inaurata madagascariensis]